MPATGFYLSLYLQQIQLLAVWQANWVLSNFFFFGKQKKRFCRTCNYFFYFLERRWGKYKHFKDRQNVFPIQNIFWATNMQWSKMRVFRTSMLKSATLCVLKTLYVCWLDCSLEIHDKIGFKSAVENTRRRSHWGLNTKLWSKGVRNLLMRKWASWQSMKCFFHN